MVTITYNIIPEISVKCALGILFGIVFGVDSEGTRKTPDTLEISDRLCRNTKYTRIIRDI